MAGEKILLVEDAEDIRVSFEMLLEESGYQVTGAADGDEALRELYRFQPDIVLLDIMLPGLSGFDLCERIRAMSGIPVIMLTALASEREKLRAFDLGADDYVVKGTGTGELLARISAALRRARMPEAGGLEERYADAAIEVDFARHLVSVRGQSVALTPIEYGLLTTLLKNEGRPTLPAELLNAVWGSGYDPELVKWHIGRLRRKVEEDPEAPKLVVTRRGYGYVYAAPAE